MFWILALSYWIHLLATIIWLGGILLMALIAWPALRQGNLEANQWFNLQRRFLPWANASLVILLLTGFLQMTNDPNYNGFLEIDSLWGWAILLKHIAYLAMVMITIYIQAVLYPAMSRLAILAEKKPELAQKEKDLLRHKEVRFLWLNIICALAVLLFTAIATAV